MKLATRIFIAMVVLVCTCTAVWGQLRTSDNRLFTLPPSNVAAPQVPVSAALGAKATQLETVFLNFDGLPPSSEWFTWDCTGQGSGIVSHGILTINSPSDCYEYDLFAPLGAWNKFVSNSRGWIVEAGLKVDPATDPDCNNGRGAVIIWANDRTNLIIVGFSTNEICISYPESAHFPMNTTDSVHVY